MLRGQKSAKSAGFLLKSRMQNASILYIINNIISWSLILCALTVCTLLSHLIGYMHCYFTLGLTVSLSLYTLCQNLFNEAYSDLTLSSCIL